MHQQKLHRCKPLIALAALCLSTTGQAQAPQKMKLGNSSVEALKATLRPNGVLLEGNAARPVKFRDPQLEVDAQRVAIDYANNRFREVRALGNVSIKVNLAPKGGGPASRIEALANEATLNPVDRTLVLTGNVRGFYEPPGRGRNALTGQKATLRFVDKNLLADVQGGSEGVRVVVPDAVAGQVGEVGTVTVTSRNVNVDQNGRSRFTGNARAVSSGGARRFDVSAPEFVVTTVQGTGVSTLETSGRTRIVLELPPPEPKPTDGTPTPEGATPGIGSTLGSPTHVEVQADSAVLTRSDSTLLLTGNVSGFYRLSPQGGTPTDYNFSGARATMRFPKAGLSVEVTEATLDTPPLELGL